MVTNYNLLQMGGAGQPNVFTVLSIPNQNAFLVTPRIGDPLMLPLYDGSVKIMVSAKGGGCSVIAARSIFSNNCLFILMVSLFASICRLHRWRLRRSRRSRREWVERYKW